jgi:hypothetical protein
MVIFLWLSVYINQITVCLFIGSQDARNWILLQGCYTCFGCPVTQQVFFIVVDIYGRPYFYRPWACNVCWQCPGSRLSICSWNAVQPMVADGLGKGRWENCPLGVWPYKARVMPSNSHPYCTRMQANLPAMACPQLRKCPLWGIKCIKQYLLYRQGCCPMAFPASCYCQGWPFSGSNKLQAKLVVAK